jgi:hypothetical protein
MPKFHLLLNMDGTSKITKSTPEIEFHVKTGLCPYTKAECRRDKCPKLEENYCEIHGKLKGVIFDEDDV